MTIMLGIFMSSMIVSCSGDDDDPSGEEKVDKQNINSNADLGKNDAMRWEMPRLRTGKGIYFITHYANRSNSTSINKVVNYSFEYDSASYHTRWVAFNFDDVTRQENHSGRTDAWDEDHSLPATCRLLYNAYSGSGYNRGHLCASQDRQFSTEANEQTFYMSNMSPQIGNFNSYYWVVLEGLVQRWGRSGKYSNLYVTKGGTIEPDKLLGTWSTTNKNGNKVKVAIPKYYFMAILGETTNKTYQAIGFLLEHKDYGYSRTGPRGAIMQTHAMSIDDLEQFTGIDFFCNLPDKLENAVESEYNINGWTWKSNYD